MLQQIPGVIVAVFDGHGGTLCVKIRRYRQSISLEISQKCSKMH
jgi:serine/threonine protein phosphatase PrpC